MSRQMTNTYEMRLKPGRFLDPKSDLVFKKIFGENKDLVKSFLNSLLPLEENALIDTIEYLSPEQVPPIPTMRRTIVDVKCKDQRGRIFIVEMQLDWSTSFMKRLQFGAAKAYVSQLNKGEEYASLCPVYGLGLIREVFDSKSTAWYHHYKTVNILDTNKQLEGLEYIFVELPKFKPTTQWEKKLGVLWLRFLNEIESMSEIPTEFKDVPELCKAVELSQESAYTKGELEAYDQYWDAVSTEKTRTVDAWTEGKEEGLAEGFAKGEQKGKEEGLVDAAHKAIKAGMLKIERAGEVFGLTAEQEEFLRRKLT
jgi:predicted transposase/invertase (TIGR01784 family)